MLLWLPCTTHNLVTISAMLLWLPCPTHNLVTISAMLLWLPCATHNLVTISAMLLWLPCPTHNLVTISAVLLWLPCPTHNLFTISAMLLWFSCPKNLQYCRQLHNEVFLNHILHPVLKYSALLVRIQTIFALFVAEQVRNFSLLMHGQLRNITFVTVGVCGWILLLFEFVV